MAHKTHKKTLIIALLLVAVAVGALLLLRSMDDGDQMQTEADPTPETELINEPTINLNPPTQEEQDAGNQQKEVIVQQENQELPDEAQVAITDAAQYGGQVEVRAFVTNSTAAGTCEVVFTKDNESITKNVSAIADASSALCEAVIVPRSEFPSAGIWQVQVTYENTSIMGSASSTIEVE